MTNQQIIEARKATANKGAPDVPWSDSILFAREIEKLVRAECEKGREVVA